MSNVKQHLRELQQLTKADAVGLLEVYPALKEEAFVDSSELDFFRELGVARYQELSASIFEGTENTVSTFTSKDKIIFFKIFDNTKILYASASGTNINQGKFQSMLNLVSSHL